jgi:hypothetical protein
MLVDLPLSQVRAVAARRDVQFVEYDQKATSPPASSGSLSAARSLMQSDTLFTFATNGFIGLLDTGVHSAHTLFTNPSHLGFLEDCYNGTSNNCMSGNNLNPDDTSNHGTAAASEITGNNKLGNTNRGITQLTLDSWKIYNSQNTYSAAAVTRAYQAGYNEDDEIEIVNIQDNTGYLSNISMGADNLFDMGMVMVAPVGNGGSFPGALFPGASKKVLGVGAINVVDQTLQSYSGRGPANPDAQIKPDLVGPTDVFAASTQGFTALLNPGFSGTSAAGPNVGAVTGLAYGLLSNNSGGFIDPGILYSYMIMIGNNPNFDNNSGAGLPVVLTTGNVGAGTYSITNGVDTLQPWTVTNSHSVDIAIWWPETEQQSHNIIYLYATDASGGVYRSLNAPSVFQKIHVCCGAVIPGGWTITIRGARVQGAQSVYLFALNQ